MALVNGLPSGSQLRIASYNTANLYGSDPISKNSPQAPVGESFVPTAASESDLQVKKVQVDPSTSKLDAARLARLDYDVASSLSGNWGSLSGMSSAWLERKPGGVLEQTEASKFGEASGSKLSASDHLLDPSSDFLIPRGASDHFFVTSSFSLVNDFEPIQNPDGYKPGSEFRRNGEAPKDFQSGYGELTLYPWNKPAGEGSESGL